MTTKVASRELLTGLKRKIIEVEVPELGEGVVIRLKQLPICAVDTAKASTPRAEELSKMIVDENGDPMFDSPEGVAIIADWPMSVGVTLMVAGQDMNLRSKKSLEEKIKNSE